MGSGSGASHGMFIIKLKHWDERQGKENSVDAISAEIYRRTASIKNASIFVFSPPMISGYGTGNSFELYMQDRSGKGIEALNKVTDDFLVALNRCPEIQMAYTSFSARFPQYRVDVDEAQCQRAVLLQKRSCLYSPVTWVAFMLPISIVLPNFTG